MQLMVLICMYMAVNCKQPQSQYTYAPRSPIYFLRTLAPDTFSLFDTQFPSRTLCKSPFLRLASLTTYILNYLPLYTNQINHPSMAAIGTSAVSDGLVLSVINKRLRALRKKYNRILQMEELLSQGKSLKTQ